MAAPEKPNTSSTDKDSDSLTKTSDISQSSSLPAKKPKPQPRVLPKPPCSVSKVLKDSKNQSTARESKNLFGDSDSVNKKQEPFKSGSGLLQELKKKQTDASSSSSPNVSKSDTKPPLVTPKPSSRSGPPTAMKPKPSIPSKPVAPMKPNNKIGTMEAGDTKSEDSSTFTKKRVLPSIGDGKPVHELSSGDPNQKKDLRTTSSFRLLSPDLGKKEVKSSSSFRSVLGPTVVSSPTDYLSRLKKKPEADKTTNCKEVKDAMVDKLKKDGASLLTTEDSNKSGGLEFSKYEENCDNEKSQARPRRKSSVSHVESPLEKEKTSTPSLSRQSSITGSAYAPIGFKSPMTGEETESKSRGNSFSSVEPTASDLPKSDGKALCEDALPSNTEMPSKQDSDSMSYTSASDKNSVSSSNIPSSDPPKKAVEPVTLSVEKADDVKTKDDVTSKENEEIKEDPKKDESTIKSVPQSVDKDESQSNTNKFGVQLRKKEKVCLKYIFVFIS